MEHRAPPDMNVAEWAASLGSVDNLAPVYALTRVAKFAKAGKVDLAGWLLLNHAVNIVPDFPAQLKFRLKLRIVSDPRLGWEELEAAAGLGSPAARFRLDVADALSKFLFMDLLDGEDEWLRALRKRWGKVSARAETLLAGLEKLNGELATLPSWEDRPPRLLASFKEELEGLVIVARQQAGASPGRPVSYFVFEYLVCSLAEAFENATGREAKVNWNPIESCYQGSLLRMVEVALPKLSKIFSGAGCALARPNTPAARGVFIFRALQRSKSRPAER